MTNDSFSTKTNFLCESRYLLQQIFSFSTEENMAKNLENYIEELEVIIYLHSRTYLLFFFTLSLIDHDWYQFNNNVCKSLHPKSNNK